MPLLQSSVSNGHSKIILICSFSYYYQCWKQKMFVFVKGGKSLRRNVFYTVHTVSAIALHLNFALTGECTSLHSIKKKKKKKNNLCMLYKHFEKWGHGQYPHKSPSPCNTCHTLVIIQMHVLFCQKNTRTRAHTQICTCTHSQTKSCGTTARTDTKNLHSFPCLSTMKC